MSFNETNVCNKQTSKKASSFYKLISSFYFVATLILTRSTLDLSLPVIELSQGKEINPTDLYHLLDSLKSIILPKRNNVNEYHITAAGLFFK